MKLLKTVEDAWDGMPLAGKVGLAVLCTGAVALFLGRRQVVRVAGKVQKHLEGARRSAEDFADEAEVRRVEGLMYRRERETA